MSKIILLAAASGMLAIVATPVTASVKNSNEQTQATGADAKPAPAKYCVVDSSTGTRIPKKVCLTRDDWLKRGFDPLEK